MSNGKIDFETKKVKSCYRNVNQFISFAYPVFKVICTSI